MEAREKLHNKVIPLVKVLSDSQATSEAAQEMEDMRLKYPHLFQGNHFYGFLGTKLVLGGNDVKP